MGFTILVCLLTMCAGTSNCVHLVMACSHGNAMLATNEGITPVKRHVERPQRRPSADLFQQQLEEGIWKSMKWKLEMETGN